MDEVALLYTLYRVCAIAEPHSREVPRRRRRQQSKFSDARITRSRRHSDAGGMDFGSIPASSGPWTCGAHPAQWPAAFCHRESNWLTTLKGLVTYTVPKVDVLVSGTLHSLPYPGNNFPSVANHEPRWRCSGVSVPNDPRPIVLERSGVHVLEHRRAGREVRRSADLPTGPNLIENLLATMPAMIGAPSSSWTT